jgi:hypothetical protein
MLVMVMQASPMLQIGNNTFNVFVIIQLLFTLLAGLFIRLQEGMVIASYSFGYSEFFITTVLFVTNIGVLVALVVFLLSDLSAHSKVSVLRFASTGNVVQLSKPPKGQYHLFLSHAHKHGADQVAIIKYQLEKMIPGVQIFLDVDSDRLRAGTIAANLHGIVKKARALLIYLTNEVFTSWVNAELRTSIKASTGMIAVRETDPRHGGVGLAEMTAQCPKDLASVLFKEAPVPWVRDIHSKTVSLKKIAQRLLVISEPAKHFDAPSLTVPGEIASLHFGTGPPSNAMRLCP